MARFPFHFRFVLLWLLTLVVIVVPAVSQDQHKDFAFPATLDAYVKPLGEAGHFSGCVLVTRHGKVIYEKAFGMANADYGIPNTPQTRFCIASITKAMTRVIAIRLLEQRRLALQDPLSKWLPGFPEGDKITVEMLLRHRSGIPHRITQAHEECSSYTAADMTEKAKQAKLAFPPGQRHLYSSGGYAVLARVLELAAGKSFDALLQEYVIQPAGLKATSDFHHDSPIPHRAQEFILDAKGPVRAPLKDYSFLVGGGSIFSTLGDVHRFCDAVLDGKFGEGVKRSLSQNGVIFTNGSTNGFRFFASFDRTNGYGLVVAANLGSGANDLLQRDLPLIMQGKPVSPPVVPKPATVALSAERFPEYLGRFRWNDVELTMRVRNGKLYGGDYQLTPVGPDKFFAYGNYGDVQFRRDDKGLVKEMQWNMPLGDSTWLKQPDDSGK